MKNSQVRRKNVFVALLRAVNVGGHAVLKMEVLRKRFESFGVTDVSTYIQSGNVIFSTPETNSANLAGQLEKHLSSSLKTEIKLLLLTPDELKSAAAGNPFASELQNPAQQCYLMFLFATPDAAHRKVLMEMQSEEYRLHVQGRILYYTYSREFAGKRKAINFEKVLGVSGTARNWKVVEKLIEISAGLQESLQ